MPKINLKKSIPAVLILALLGGGAFYYAGIQKESPSSPADTAHNFFLNVRAGQTAEAYARTSAGFKSKTNLEQFQVFADQVAKLPAGEMKKIFEEEEGGTVTVVFELQGEKEAFQLSAGMSREAGEWKVEGVQIIAKSE